MFSNADFFQDQLFSIDNSPCHFKVDYDVEVVKADVVKIVRASDNNAVVVPPFSREYTPELHTIVKSLDATAIPLEGKQCFDAALTSFYKFLWSKGDAVDMHVFIQNSKTKAWKKQMTVDEQTKQETTTPAVVKLVPVVAWTADNPKAVGTAITPDYLDKEVHHTTPSHGMRATRACTADCLRLAAMTMMLRTGKSMLASFVAVIRHRGPHHFFPC